MTFPRFFFALLSFGVGAGCTLLTDLSGYSDGANDVDASFDGAVTDVATSDVGPLPDAVVDGGADDAEAGPRTNSCGAPLFGQPIPLFNGGFELGCANGWSPYVAASDPTGIASQGSIACRVCAGAGGAGPDGYFVAHAEPGQLVAGEHYELVACVRSAPDAGAEGVRLEINNANGTDVVTTDDYRPVRNGFTVDVSSTAFNIRVRDYNPLAGSCFLVDDVRLTKIP